MTVPQGARNFCPSLQLSMWLVMSQLTLLFGGPCGWWPKGWSEWYSNNSQAGLVCAMAFSTKPVILWMCLSPHCDSCQNNSNSDQYVSLIDIVGTSLDFNLEDFPHCDRLWHFVKRWPQNLFNTSTIALLQISVMWNCGTINQMI